MLKVSWEVEVRLEYLLLDFMKKSMWVEMLEPLLLLGILGMWVEYDKEVFTILLSKGM